MLLSHRNSTILTYIIGILIVLYMVKPPMLFKPTGKLREYGFNYGSDGHRKTLLLSMHNVIIFTTVLLFLYI
jgi:hypothetical protein